MGCVSVSVVEFVGSYWWKLAVGGSAIKSATMSSKSLEKLKKKNYLIYVIIDDNINFLDAPFKMWVTSLLM